MSLFTAIRETYTGFKSLLTGMRITGREAMRPVITVQYPRETLPMPARFRGHIKLVLDPETGRPRCTACTLCAKACPSGCIELDGIKREGDKKKSVSRYELDFTKCSLCGSCVEVCPSEAIDFSKDYNVVSLSRDTFAQMDLYAKVEAEAADWARLHPPPAVAEASADASTAAAPAVANPAATGRATP
ncbi:MAG TPA: NADH-quinone oxidoreductase subunit I [Opitutaceae bacterium]|nr:NADH-quinone oxidoreductase subunit I [Opitutaceae bacterium]